MITLTNDEKTDLATLDKDGDFGLNTTYMQPGDEVAHLNDAELLAQLNSDGDFDSVGDHYNKPELIAETEETTIIIKAKKSAVLFPEIEQFFQTK
jgi:hypothetical protein